MKLFLDGLRSLWLNFVDGYIVFPCLFCMLCALSTCVFSVGVWQAGCVEEYRHLLEVKANTPLYFDFSDLQQDPRCAIFRLLGDLTSFVDDIAEIDGLSLRNLPQA